MKFFIAILISSFSFLAVADSADWEQAFLARGNGETEASAIKAARRVVERDAVAYEAKCLSTNGQWTFSTQVANCYKLHPAPGFPDEAVCRVSGLGLCAYLEVRDVVQVTKDSDLYETSKVVGSVKAGEVYLLSKIESDWGLLEKLSGSPITGWINIKNLKSRQLVEVLEDTKLFTGKKEVGGVKKGQLFLRGKVDGVWAALDNLDGSPVTGWIKATLLKDTKF